MRFIPLFLILFLISSCANREEKQAMQNDDSIQMEYLRKGGEIANITQSELLIAVSTAMNKGGPVYAIEFCNLNALPIKDSLSRLHDCQIRRIAEKYRNPEDRPLTETEEKQLNYYELAFQKGDSLKPEIHLFQNRIEYYQPIMINMEACLKCHGDPGKQIAEETLKKIQAHYPNDLATGFQLNDFRGAWKITFTK